MSKTGSTKNKILECIGTGQKTMSEISTALNLAPSTVSQHIQELEYMGAIEKVENEHIRKWKYYKLNPNFNKNVSIVEMMNRRMAQNKVVYYLITAIAVLAIAYFAVTSATGSRQTTTTATYSAATVNVPLRLTDPPTVPKGTSSLMLTYSSVGVESINSSGIKTWTYLNTSGSIDLMSLINSSQVIGNVSVSDNSMIEAVSLKIVSAEVTINGTTYNVTTPSSQITAGIATTNKVNDSNGVLLDFSPTVVSAYANGSTIFILLPSIKAAVVPNPPEVNFGPAGTKIAINVGQRFALQDDERAYLNYSSTNLSITNAAITAGNGTVGLSVTVKNNGNQSVNIQSIAIVGKEMPYIILNQSCGQSNRRMIMCRYLVNRSAQGGAQTDIRINTQTQVAIGSMNTRAGFGIGGQGGPAIVEAGMGSGFVQVNTPINTSGNAQAFAISVRHINKTDSEVVGNGSAFNFRIVTGNNSTVLSEIGNDMLSVNTSTFVKEGVPEGVSIAAAGPILELTNRYRAIIFFVEANGTLQTNGFFSAGDNPLAVNYNDAFNLKTIAVYGLAAETSHTFTYNGTVLRGPPGFRLSFVPGDTYTVVVQADGRIFQQNVTAV